MRSLSIRIADRGTGRYREGIRAWAELLQEGGVAAFPTDTVWGLGAVARQDRAVEAIRRAKGRGETAPVACLIARVDQARSLAATWTPDAERLARRFWPGALTIVVPTRGLPYPAAQRGRATLGLRVPTGRILGDLLALLGEPLAATSANLTGCDALADTQAIESAFAGILDVLVQTDEPPAGLASTVVEVTGEGLHVLRVGAVDPSAAEDPGQPG